MIADSILNTIAQTYGTPTYVYDLDKVSQQISTLRTALPEATALYAVKANSCGAVLRHMSTLDMGAEVISLGELERSTKANISPENILLSGPRQDAALIERALELGVQRVSLDSVSQWEMWQSYDTQGVHFYPRVNPALDPRTHEHLATGAAESKFGMTVAESEEVARALSKRHQLAGFHIHAGSQISEGSVYDEIFAVLAPLYETFPAAKNLDIGGGFAVPDFDLASFAAKTLSFAERFDLHLTIEPGRYLVAEAGILVTKVLHTKSGALNHVIADAGMADLLRPALYSSAHPIQILGKTGTSYTADVDGPLCENADRLGRGVALPKVEKGDLLIVEQAGAYGFAMSSNYASSLRPAEVVVKKGEVRLARKRETVEDLWAREC